MTENRAYITIEERAAALEKDEKIKEKALKKFGKNRQEAKRYIYKLAAATLYGNRN